MILKPQPIAAVLGFVALPAPWSGAHLCYVGSDGVRVRITSSAGSKLPTIDIDGGQIAERLSLVHEPRHLSSLADQGLCGPTAIAIMRDLRLHGALALQHGPP